MKDRVARLDFYFNASFALQKEKNGQTRELRNIYTSNRSHWRRCIMRKSQASAPPQRLNTRLLSVR